MDQLILQTSWHSSKSDSLVLSDLLIEGALIENRTLRECKSSSESINVVPNCYVNWVEKVDIPSGCINFSIFFLLKQKVTRDNFVEYPLYTNSSRESKITNIQVECDVNLKERYVLSGLAFYLKY